MSPNPSLDPGWMAIVLTMLAQVVGGVWIVARLATAQSDLARALAELRTALGKLQDLYTETHTRLAVVEDRQKREAAR